MFLPPGTFDFRYKARDSPKKAEHKEKNYDEEMYPELYRKYKSASDYIKGSNLECPKPFEIGECRVVSFRGGLSQCTYLSLQYNLTIGTTYTRDQSKWSTCVESSTVLKYVCAI